MKRRLFNAGAVVSLVLCVAAISLYPLAYYFDSLLWVYGTSRRPPMVYVGIGKRSLEIAWRRYQRFTGAEQVSSYRFAGVGVSHTWNGPEVGWSVRIPKSYLVALTLIWPACWMAARLRPGRRTQRVPSCPACGYDLRGTPASEAETRTCPECGSASSGKRGAKA